MVSFGKRIILKAMPDSDLLRALAHKPRFETWVASRADGHPILDTREQLYEFVNKAVLCNAPINYLEFGVYKGDSIKCFAELNTNSASRFVGFDTFEGLPEDWVDNFRTVKSKTFSTDGEAPRTNDPRMTFVKGLFQNTLPQFMESYEDGRQLVIHNDSDLYSSTMYVLTYCHEVLKPGTILIFDEFYSVMHEFRALEDYCSSYCRQYTVVAATTRHAQVAIRML